MKILFSPFSPYVRKCLVAAHELGIVNHIELLPSNAHPVNRDAKIIAFNPLGKVPTFFTDDGQVLYDSRVICEYLDHQAHGSLIPKPGSPDRWSTLTRQALGDGMLDALLLARYEDVARPETLRWPDWRAAQLDKAHTALAHLSAKSGLLPLHADMGTIAIGCALWYLDLRFPDLNWRSMYPRVADWYAEFSRRPSMAAVWSVDGV